MKVPVDLIKESKIVHISSSGDYKFNINCAKVAYDNNILVSFDAGNDPFTEIPEYLKARTHLHLGQEPMKSFEGN